MQLLPWSIALAVALQSAPAFAQARPRKPQDDVDVSAFREQLIVVHDGSDLDPLEGAQQQRHVAHVDARLEAKGARIDAVDRVFEVIVRLERGDRAEDLLAHDRLIGRDVLEEDRAQHPSRSREGSVRDRSGRDRRIDPALDARGGGLVDHRSDHGCVVGGITDA